MPIFEASTTLLCPHGELFDFLIRPANLARVSPPELNLKLSKDAPEILELGSVLVLTTRRWGFLQRFISQVIKFDHGSMFVEEQRHGPFKRMVHYHHVETDGTTVRMVDRIDYEPPGGPLGMMMSADRLHKEMTEMYAYRTQKFKEILEAPKSA